MSREELSIQIEKYLDGALSAEEAKKLELLIMADDRIAKEMALHQNLREGIRAYYERLQLKNKMNSWEDDKTFPIKQKKQGNLWRPVMAAASISLLVTVGGVSLYHFAFRNNIDGNIKNEITTLSREIESNAQATDQLNKELDAVTAVKKEPRKKVVGTAFMISSDGYLLTNQHIIKDALAQNKPVTLEQQIDGRTVSFKADIVSQNSKLDFALLRINDSAFTAYPRIPYSISDKHVTIAEKIYTLGYPKNDIVYTEGAISSLSGLKSDTMFYQLNIISAPGYSGSPIINEKGELVGILSAKNALAEGETYCLKMQYILDEIEKLKTENKNISIKTNTHSRLSGKRLTDQVKAVMPFVFIVKA